MASRHDRQDPDPTIARRFHIPSQFGQERLHRRLTVQRRARSGRQPVGSRRRGRLTARRARKSAARASPFGMPSQDLDRGMAQGSRRPRGAGHDVRFGQHAARPGRLIEQAQGHRLHRRLRPIQGRPEVGRVGHAMGGQRQGVLEEGVGSRGNRVPDLRQAAAITGARGPPRRPRPAGASLSPKTAWRPGRPTPRGRRVGRGRGRPSNATS